MSGEETTTMAMGPVQMLVLGFAEPNFTGKIAAELDRLREHEFVKIVDALVVNKDDEGNITALQVSDLSRGRVDRDGRDRRRADRLRLRRGDEDAIEAGAELGAEAMADGHLIPEERRLVRRRRDPERIRRGDRPARAPLGDPAPRRDRRCRWHRARRRVDPRERPDRRRRRCSSRVALTCRCAGAG